MGYEIIVNPEEKNVEVHWDMCDDVFDKKDNFELNNKLQYVTYHLYEEVENYLNQLDEDYEIIFCEKCKPQENKEKYDEEYDDFYVEFDEDDEPERSRCDLI
jgi:hypothetical protein